jgi:hypothetical protein
MVKYVRAFRYRTPDRLVHQAWYRAGTSRAVSYTECDADVDPPLQAQTHAALTCLWCVQDVNDEEVHDS